VDTVTVTSDYTVYPGETLDFTNVDGFYIQEQSSLPAPNLDVQGHVNVVLNTMPAAGYGGVAGISIGYSGFYDSLVTIEPGASFTVTSTVSGAGAVGYSAGSWSPDFTNKGTFSVSAVGQATGLSTWDAGTIQINNDGLFTVTSSQDRAIGLVLANGGYFHNSGDLEVSGKTFATGISTAAHEELFDNTGTIRAVSQTPGDATAVAWGFGFYNHGWTNEGLIQGDVALQASTYSGAGDPIAYTNSGTMIGDVNLTSVVDTFTNTGTIEGQVTLGLGNDVFDSHAGMTTGAVSGGDGADSIAGGSGGETLMGDGGADTITGGLGDDLIGGGRDSDHLDGGAGFDTVTYSDATMSVNLDLNFGTANSSGNDVVTGFEGVVGGDYNDTLAGSFTGGDTLDGGAGDDQVSGRDGDDLILGGAGHNYLRGDDGQDTLQGGADFDDINGNKGDDSIDGGSGGADWLVGGQGNDVITAHHLGNILYGNLGSDTLNGGDGNELIRGGQADDVLFGGAGNDWMSGDRGSDTLTGGTGADTFHASAGAGLDIVTDFHSSDGDHVQLDAGTAYTVSQVGADVHVDIAGGDQMVLQNVDLSTLPTGWIFTL
jgi:Ca2+-binding RTX toxin-like protein